MLLRPKTLDIVEEEYDPRAPLPYRFMFSGKPSRREIYRRNLLAKLRAQDALEAKEAESMTAYANL